MKKKEFEYITDALRALILSSLILVALWLLCSLVTSCATKREVEHITDTLYQVRMDSIEKTVMHTVYQDRVIDHYINNTYIVSPLGDTLKEKVYEKVFMSFNREQHDSITSLIAQLDSVGRTKTKYIVQQEDLSWFEQMQLDAFWWLVGLCTMLIAILLSKFR